MPKLETIQTDDRRTELVDLLVSLADQNGITPQDVITHAPCWPTLVKEGVVIGTYTTMMVHEAQGKMRQGIKRSILLVDELNRNALKSMGMEDSHAASDGDVKLVTKKSEPAIKRTREHNSNHLGSGSRVDILGYPSTEILKVMGSIGFQFNTARRVLDDLGGAGVADSTIKGGLYRGRKGDEVPEVPDDIMAELVAYLV